MQYRELGKTGMMVSRVGLGGENVTKASYEITRDLVNAADEGGLNIIDAFMPQPEVRTHFGKALDGRRDRFIIQGHLGSILKDGQYFRTREVRDSEEYLKDFLTRFRTDYIDVGVIHYVDTDEDFDKVFSTEFITFAQRLKQEGVLRALGVSSHNPITAKKIAETGIIDVILFSINPAYDLMPVDTTVGQYMSGKAHAEKHPMILDPRRGEFYRTCVERGVGITVMKTFAAGRLLSDESSPFGYALTPHQCMSYALDRPGVASVLVGARTAEEMRASLAFEDATAEEKDYSKIFLHSGGQLEQNRCMYCNHCLPCPKNIDVADVTKYADILEETGDSDSIRNHYAALTAHGSDCIGCGACEKRCPFQVPVRKNMEKAVKLFGY
ncbi:MAG: aldo/keto reductase [Clostridia bacterium]|nr:aldo/keto reductase [Clostridia bacterium]